MLPDPMAKALPGPARAMPLDVLRGIAVLLVLAHHKPIAPFLTLGGWNGVDLFFVLSGFLVSGLLFEEFLKTGRMDVVRFLVRRGFKIYPSFFFLLAVTVLGPLAVTGKLPWWVSVLTEMAFLQNYLYPLWGHTWSLAVEEHFYLMLAATLMLLARRRREGADPFRPLIRIFMAAAFAILLMRALTFAFRPYEYGTHHYPTHLRIDGLFFGALLAYFRHFHAAATRALVERHRPILALASLAAVLPAYFLLQEGALMNTLGLTFQYLGFGGILLLCIDWGGSGSMGPLRGPAILYRPLAMIGFYSYTIYLWHLPVRHYGKAALERLWGGPAPYALDLTVYLAGCLLAGILASKLVEAPFLKLRDRYFPKTAAAPALARKQPAPAAP